MGKRIELGDLARKHDMEIVQHGRFYYPLAIRDGVVCGIFSSRSHNQQRFTQHLKAVGFASLWFNWYSHADDTPRYYLAVDGSEQDHLVKRSDPFKHGKE